MRRLPRPVLIISGIMAFALLGDSALYVVLPVYPEAPGLERLALVGLLLSANRFVRLLTNELATRSFIRWGKRPSLLLAVSLSVITTLSYGLFQGFWPLLAARLLWGAAFSLLRLGAYEAVVDLAPAGERGLVLGWYNRLSRLGSIAGILIGGVLGDLFGFRPAFLTLGLLTLVTLPLYRMVLPLIAERDPHRVASRAPVPDPVQQGAPGRNLAPAARLLFSAASVGFATALVASTLGLVISQVLGGALRGGVLGAATATGVLAACRYLSDLFLAPFCGRLTDQYGRRPLILMATATYLVSIAVLMFARSPAGTFAAVIVIYICSTALQTAMDASAADLAAAQPGRHFMGRYAYGVDLGSALAPLVGFAGVAAGAVGMYAPAAGVLTITGALWLHRLRQS